MYNLFLDDDPNRIPNKLYWIELPLVEWIIVRSYNEFVQYIEKNGIPEIISLDHDLGTEHYQEFHRANNSDKIINYENLKEKTGFDAAKYLAMYCIEHKLKIPIYFVHTMNPIGKENIISILESARKIINTKYMEPKEQLNVYLLVGGPGSGKTTYGKKFVEENPGTIRLCPDEFRAKLGKSESDQSVSAIAFEATRKALDEALYSGKNVMIDATNMYIKSRKDFINIARDHGAKVNAIVFEVSKEVLMKRNIKRGLEGGRNVPEDVVNRMLMKYQKPDTKEFDKVEFIC